MADQIDNANEYAQAAADHQVAEIRKKAQLPKGVAGECDLCGEWSGRLITGVCAPCRDRRGLA